MYKMEQIKEEVKTYIAEYLDTKLMNCVKYTGIYGDKIPAEWCKKCEFYDEKTKSHAYNIYKASVKREKKTCGHDDLIYDIYSFKWKCPYCDSIVEAIYDYSVLEPHMQKPFMCDTCNTYFAIIRGGYKEVEFAVTLQNRNSKK